MSVEFCDVPGTVLGAGNMMESNIDATLLS